VRSSRNAGAVFIAATFASAWVLWLAADRVVQATGAGAGTRALLFLPGTFSPAIVALWLSARSRGEAGIAGLVGGIARWEVGARWWVFAIGFMATVKLLAAGGHRVLEGSWPAFGQVPLVLMLGSVILSTPFQAGEELGWRGYALPRLADRMGMAAASLVLGVVWATWHLPLFYLPSADLTGQPFPVFLVAVTALSVAMAWLYAGTGRSLLLVMVMHAAVNNTTGIVPGGMDRPAGVMTLDGTVVGWLTAAILAAFAVAFLVTMRRVSR
jgi:uncharacterized protein